ncbi:hypothetical protein D3C87_158080 [compost metagenome]
MLYILGLYQVSKILFYSDKNVLMYNVITKLVGFYKPFISGSFSISCIKGINIKNELPMFLPLLLA